MLLVLVYFDFQMFCTGQVLSKSVVKMFETCIKRYSSVILMLDGTCDSCVYKVLNFLMLYSVYLYFKREIEEISIMRVRVKFRCDKGFFLIKECYFEQNNNYFLIFKNKLLQILYVYYDVSKSF